MVSSGSLLLINFCLYRKLFLFNVVSSNLPRNLFLIGSSYSPPFTLHKKMKFSIEDFFIFGQLTEKILNGKLHFRTVSARVFRLILRHFRISLSFCRYVSVMTRAGFNGRQLLCFRSLAKKALQH